MQPLTAEQVGARIDARVAAAMRLVADAEPEPEFGGYSVPTLRDALAKIQSHLSAPVDAWVRWKNEAVTLAAIRFYCGEPLVAQRVKGWIRVIWTPEAEAN